MTVWCSPWTCRLNTIRGSPTSFSLTYVFLSLGVLQHSIRKRLRESEDGGGRAEETHRSACYGLSSAEGIRLKEVGAKRQSIRTEYPALSRTRRDFPRILTACWRKWRVRRRGSGVQRELKENLESQILQMQGDLSRLQAKLVKPKHRNKASEVAERRFRVLYKNLLFTDRAIEGFTALTEEYQLKAEEVIHRLNQDESLVSVRRKVFGKGGKLDVLEADFSYSGRLYFQKDSQSTKTRILAIGTKNSQEKDIAYLGSLK